jgi:hypothetical protein
MHGARSMGHGEGKVKSQCDSMVNYYFLVLNLFVLLFYCSIVHLTPGSELLAPCLYLLPEKPVNPFGDVT